MNKVMVKKGVYILVLVLLLIPLVTAQPGIVITSPQEGEAIASSQVPVIFTVQNSETYSEPIHVHFTLDTEAPRMHFSLEPYVLDNIAPGSHVLLAELVNANHVSLPNPEARAFVSFTTTSTALPMTTPEVPSDGVSPPSPHALPPSTLPIGQVYEAMTPSGENTCTNGVQDAGEEGVDCGITVCGVPCATQTQLPVEQVSGVPVGEAGGYMSRVLTAVKGSLTSMLLLLLAVGAIIGAYFGYTKLYQGHYVAVPEEVQFNAQLYAYIKECVEKGFPKDAIYTKLKQLNFKEGDLDYHFSLAQEKQKAK